MKRIIKYFFINLLVIYFISQHTSGMIFERGIETMIFTGAVLAGVSFLGKPVINLLLLPLNLVTFGLFRWVSSAIALYLVTLVVPSFKIAGFFFQGFENNWLSIPQINLAGVLAFVGFAFLISFSNSILHWIFG